MRSNTNRLLNPLKKYRVSLEPDVPSTAIKFQNSTYMTLGAKLGEPLSITLCGWFNIPTGLNLTTAPVLQSFGTNQTEDTDFKPALVVQVNGATSSGSALGCLNFNAYSYDGFNPILKWSAAILNPANPALRVYNLKRDTWYGYWISINFDDGNACQMAVWENKTAPCWTNWYGDSDPFITYINLQSQGGPATYRMYCFYSLSGGEAAASNGFDGQGCYPYDYTDPTLVFSTAPNMGFFQSFASIDCYTDTAAHLRLTTPQGHWKDINSDGSGIYGSLPPVFFNWTLGSPNTYQNAGFNGPYTVRGSTSNFLEMTGPV
jgi:hypothetical protein